jgi:hypothetical protein
VRVEEVILAIMFSPFRHLFTRGMDTSAMHGAMTNSPLYERFTLFTFFCFHFFFSIIILLQFLLLDFPLLLTPIRSLTVQRTIGVVWLSRWWMHWIRMSTEFSLVLV